MEVILLKDIKNLGKANQILNVKDGYAKNYLFKNNLAVAKTTSTQQQLDKKIANLNLINQQKIQEASIVKQKMENLQLVFSLPANKDQTFGSISHKQIIDELNKHDIRIDKFMFVDQQKHYLLGNHYVSIKLHPQVIANLAVKIIKK
jgi:large subunit ribosomal protein L9